MIESLRMNYVCYYWALSVNSGKRLVVSLS